MVVREGEGAFSREEVPEVQMMLKEKKFVGYLIVNVKTNEVRVRKRVPKIS